jgi:hypothetical protein
MAALPRRSALALPLLALPALRAAAVGLHHPVPPFAEWIGRTALLDGDGGAARVLLAADGGGRLSVKLFLFCRSLPLLTWQPAPDGMAIHYTRPSVLDSQRIIEGEARILPEGRQLRWVEARTHLAVFLGFTEAEAAGRCA